MEIALRPLYARPKVPSGLGKEIVDRFNIAQLTYSSVDCVVKKLEGCVRGGGVCVCFWRREWVVSEYEGSVRGLENRKARKGGVLAHIR